MWIRWIRIDPQHWELPHPTIIKELQAFLGMVNFYRRFLPSIAGMLRPLTAARRSQPSFLPAPPA
jgi:hypothetical protein